ncbi:unnamed protein product [Pleuronectes platessa]|uniref:Uncharacterized protein n=1 Tax=Pleuronectes platessa TaxID=8262 RepID=A0A9N7UJ90_PLEPL|nr:unnamed protein product [Pleuronectes platessa]
MVSCQEISSCLRALLTLRTPSLSSTNSTTITGPHRVYTGFTGVILRLQEEAGDAASSWRRRVLQAPAGPSRPPEAPHEDYDWSSVGIFKGPSIRRPLEEPVRPHSACGPSAGVLNPGAARLSALGSAAAGLARRHAPYAKREGGRGGDEEETRRRRGGDEEETRSEGAFEYICM